MMNTICRNIGNLRVSEITRARCVQKVKIRQALGNKHVNTTVRCASKRVPHIVQNHKSAPQETFARLSRGNRRLRVRSCRVYAWVICMEYTPRCATDMGMSQGRCPVSQSQRYSVILLCILFLYVCMCDSVNILATWNAKWNAKWIISNCLDVLVCVCVFFCVSCWNMQALQQKPDVSPQARRVLTMSKVSKLVSLVSLKARQWGVELWMIRATGSGLECWFTNEVHCTDKKKRKRRRTCGRIRRRSRESQNLNKDITLSFDCFC